MHAGEGNARIIVHSHEQELPAGAFDRVAPVTRHSVAGPLDAPEPLDVDVQQIAHGFVLVAQHGLARLQIRQPRQCGAGQHAADRGIGHAHLWTILACSKHLRRSSTISKAVPGEIAFGELFGRDDASSSPGRPSARQRSSHLRAVGAVTPWPAAACAAFRPRSVMS